MLHYNVSTSAEPLSSDTVTRRGMKRSFRKAFKQDNKDVQKAASFTADNASKISAADVSREPFEVTHLTDKEKLPWKFLDEFKRKRHETRSAGIGSNLESPPASNSGGAHPAVEDLAEGLAFLRELISTFDRSRELTKAQTAHV